MNDNREPNDDELDGLFRKAADGLRPQFDPEAWQRMEGMLDEHSPRRPWWRFWPAMLGLLLIGTGGGVWWTLSGSGQNSPIAPKTALSAPDTGPLAKGVTPSAALSTGASPDGSSPLATTGSPTTGSEKSNSETGTTKTTISAPVKTAPLSKTPATTLPSGNSSSIREPNNSQRSDARSTDVKAKANEKEAELKEVGAIETRRPMSLSVDSTLEKAPAGSRLSVRKKNNPALSANAQGLTPGLATAFSERTRRIMRNSARRIREGEIAQKPTTIGQSVSKGNRLAETTKPSSSEIQRAVSKGNEIGSGAAPAGNSPNATGLTPSAGSPAALAQTESVPVSELDFLTARTISVKTKAPRILGDDLSDLEADEDPEPADVRRPPVALPPHRYLILRALLAPDLNSVSVFKPSVFGSSYGLLLEYEVLPRWRVQTGVIHSKKTYTSPPMAYEWPMPLNPKPTSIDADCAILDIPLNVRFDVVHKPRFALFVNGGISSYYMLKEKYLYVYSATYKHLHDESKGRFELASTFNASIGYERRLGPRMSLQLEPYVKLPITGVGFGAVKLYSLGVHASLGFGLLKPRW